jgi:hypothetical protein
MLAQPSVILLHPLEQIRLHVIKRIGVFRVAAHPFGRWQREKIVPGEITQRLLRCRQESIAIAPIEQQRLIARTQFLHPYQPLAVRTEAEAGRVGGEIGVFVAV